jgi:5-methyltetrahydropteroyltriglutamate--homocysteine methyltransferase
MIVAGRRLLSSGAPGLKARCVSGRIAAASHICREEVPDAITTALDGFLGRASTRAGGEPRLRPPPPFRAEHIGSLLRPPALLAARQAVEEGRLTREALRTEEDARIRDAVRLQEEVGLDVITDGEFRRGIYFGHFAEAVSGFTEMDAEMSFRGAGGEALRYRAAVVTGRLVRHRGIATDEFRHVHRLTRRTPKVTLPSPSSQHFLRWRPGVSERAYPDLDEFFADVAAIYRAELADLAALGASYVQLDDVPLGLLCDPTHRRAFEAKGHDPGAMLDRYVDLVNAALAGRPPGLTVGVHVCRGNNQGKWLAEGAYDYVAARAFAGLDVDAFFLEYDSPRAGGFEPLGHVARGRWVVLGLVSTKTPVLEDPDDLRRRIDAAARVVPLDRLALSPQCGFASTAPGNPLTADEQRRKLELVVDVARRVWG